MDVGNGRGVADANQTVTALHERSWNHLHLCVLEGLVGKFNVRKSRSGDVSENVERTLRFGNDESRQ